jgi:hypothetical protein
MGILNTNRGWAVHFGENTITCTEQLKQYPDLAYYTEKYGVGSVKVEQTANRFMPYTVTYTQQLPALLCVVPTEVLAQEIYNKVSAQCTDYASALKLSEIILATKG